MILHSDLAGECSKTGFLKICVVQSMLQRRFRQPRNNVYNVIRLGHQLKHHNKFAESFPFFSFLLLSFLSSIPLSFPPPPRPRQNDCAPNVYQTVCSGVHPEIHKMEKSVSRPPTVFTLQSLKSALVCSASAPVFRRVEQAVTIRCSYDYRTH